MIGISVKTNIERPAKEVFDFLADVKNQPTYMPMIQTVELVSGTPGEVGATWKQTASMMGQEAEGTTEIAEAEPGERLLMKASTGPMVIQTLFELLDKGESTRVKMTIDPGPAGAMMGPMIKAQGEESLQLMKAALEG